MITKISRLRTVAQGSSAQKKGHRHASRKELDVIGDPIIYDLNGIAPAVTKRSQHNDRNRD